MSFIKMKLVFIIHITLNCTEDDLRLGNLVATLDLILCTIKLHKSQAVVVHLNFRDWVNLSGPSLYCTARTLG